MFDDISISPCNETYWYCRKNCTMHMNHTGWCGVAKTVYTACNSIVNTFCFALLSDFKTISKHI